MQRRLFRSNLRHPDRFELHEKTFPIVGNLLGVECRQKQGAQMFAAARIGATATAPELPVEESHRGVVKIPAGAANLALKSRSSCEKRKHPPLFEVLERPADDDRIIEKRGQVVFGKRHKRVVPPVAVPASAKRDDHLNGVVVGCGNS